MNGIPETVLTGDQALTVESFTELNSKLGAQYIASFYTASLGAGLNLDVIFTVGSEKVLIKDFLVEFTGEEIQHAIYRAPSYTGGTPIAVYNMSDAGAVPNDVTLKALVTVSSVGTQISPMFHSLGNTAAGESAQSVSPIQFLGVERLFNKNQEYLLRIKNNDTASIKLSGIATWYQGPLSTDRKGKTGGGF